MKHGPRQQRSSCTSSIILEQSQKILTSLCLTIFKRTELFNLSMGRKAVDKTCGGRLRSCAISPFRFIRRTLTPITAIYANPTAKMVLKLYSSAMSFARVLVTILEKDLPYEDILIDMRRKTKRARPTRNCSLLGRCLRWRMTGFSSLRVGLFASIVHGKFFHSHVSFEMLMKDGSENSRDSVLRMFLCKEVHFRDEIDPRGR